MMNKISQLLWQLVARIITKPFIANWIIDNAMETPYYPILSADGKELYMGRWWFFNPYGKDANGCETPAKWKWLPSVRVHLIMRDDEDRDLHDHPWNARTIVLKGGYTEETLTGWYDRLTGYTGRLLFGQYHRIRAITPGGAWTLFFTWKHRGEWGFLVNGTKVPWRTYIANKSNAQKGGRHG